MGQGTREVIDLSKYSQKEVERFYYDRTIAGFEFNEIRKEILDSEEGVITYRKIYQRISDSKFFEFEYEWLEGPGKFDFLNWRLTQVFARPTIEYR